MSLLAVIAALAAQPAAAQPPRPNPFVVVTEGAVPAREVLGAGDARRAEGLRSEVTALRAAGRSRDAGDHRGQPAGQ